MPHPSLGALLHAILLGDDYLTQGFIQATTNPVPVDDCAEGVGAAILLARDNSDYMNTIVDTLSDQLGTSFTPLHVAVSCDFGRIVELLLANHADIHALTGKGESPTEIAIRKKSSTSLPALLARVGDVNARMHDDNKLGPGARLIHCAAAYNNPGAIRQLAEAYRADTAVLTDAGDTPLHLAVRYDAADVIEELGRLGAFVRINQANNVGYRVIDAAAGYGSLATFSKVRAIPGVELHTENLNGLRPIDYAAMHGNTDIIKELIRLGADVNTPNTQGYRPLDYAVVNDHANAIKELIRLGAEADGLNTHGTRAANLAAQEGKTAALQALSDAGADLDLPDRHNAKPMDSAVGKGRTEAIRLLGALCPGAAAVCNPGGFTPMDNAKIMGNVGSAKVLQESGAGTSRDVDTALPAVSAPLPLCSDTATTTETDRLREAVQHTLAMLNAPTVSATPTVSASSSARPGTRVDSVIHHSPAAPKKTVGLGGGPPA